MTPGQEGAITGVDCVGSSGRGCLKRATAYPPTIKRCT